MARFRFFTAVLAAAVALGAAPASARQVRIISVDGRFLDRDPGPVEVWPGQVVSLAADTVWPADDGTWEYEYRPVEDFLWMADDGSGDLCDPATDCRQSSNFEATEYGVNYYVPWDAPARVEIEVRSRYDEGRDRIDLVNERARPARGGGYGYGLDGLGWWTTIEGERVFVPNAYEDDWGPYNHGYWYWTTFGWTWYSYDPWGQVTDHYGHWRHHGTFGWIWVPDPLWAWRPAIVSFFFGDGWLGWYPYDAGWSHGYRHGYAQGYDDGYWMGYWAGRHEGGRHGRRHHTGCTMVGYADFYVPGDHPRPADRADRGGANPPARAYDISKVRITDRVLVEERLLDSVKRGAVGAVPGGGTDPAAGRAFIAGKTGVLASPTSMKAFRNRDGAGPTRGFEPVRAVFERPAEYRDLGARLKETVGATRVGSVGVRAPVGAAALRSGGAASVDPAAARSARGAAVAPVQRGEGREVLRSWAPRAREAGDLRRDVGPSDVRPSVEPRTVAPAPVPRPQQVPRVRPQDVRAEPVDDGDSRWERRPDAPEVSPRVNRESVRPSVEADEAADDDATYGRYGVDRDSGLRPDRDVRPDPGFRREVERDRFDASDRTERVAPAVRPERAAPQVQPTPPRTWPTPSRPSVRPESPAPRPSPEVRAPVQSLRREVPREVPRPAVRSDDDDRPSRSTFSRPSFGGSSSSGSSSPPPAYVPPRKPSPAPGPSRFRGGPTRR